MNISSAKSPYLLQVERSDRPKATYGNRFRIAMEKEKEKSQVTETAEEEEATKGVKTEVEAESDDGPRYNITDEEADYFLEKYGEKYNEEMAAELYYELADKGAISENDAGNASGTLKVRRVYGFTGITCGGVGRAHVDLNEGVIVKDVSRTDKDSPYKSLWESFKKKYDRDIDTWEDALQENIDFERYLKEVNGGDYLLQQHYDGVIEGLERTKDVITRIFGEVTE
ncbi:MAG: hypothetical protein K2H90_09055 [Oscillospiraceae bacterium]|nr:hypothetical protein [Oscillospiraceae bacterium]